MTEIKSFVVASRARDPLNPSRRGPCYGRMRQKLEANYGGITNTISTVSKDNYLVIPVTKDNILMEQKTVIDKKQSKKRKHGLPAEMLHLDNLPEELKGKKVYIRKLTPRECYRLMDVSEENIDKLMLPKDEKGKPVISNSGHYKLAGNSIVVSCMTAMFRNLILDPPERDKIDFKEEFPLFANKKW